ncbi:hypothetical protein quinque_009171 [Culex quinquefasciatus]
MRLLASFTALGLISISAVFASLAHYTEYKSFPEALSECAEYFEVSNCTLNRIIDDHYPRNELVQRLVYCSLINLGAWDIEKHSERSHVLQGFFKPAAGDSCYQNRTQNCLKDIGHTCKDHAERAYEAFQCYYRQYGNLVDDAQYVPLELNELYTLVSTGFAIQNHPRCVLVEYSKGNILDEPNFPRTLLTGSVRGGYYSRQRGINIENMYVQFGVPELVTAETRQCCDAALKEVCDGSDAVKLHRIFKNCLKDIIPTLKLVEECAEYLEVSNCTLQWIAEDSYPNVEEVQRLIHCTLANLGAWDHESDMVRRHVLRSFFQPAAGDCCYLNRTLECLQCINSKHEDHYERVYESFQCFNHNYGSLVSSDQYVPFERSGLFRIIETGFTLRTLPRCTLEQYSEGNILDDAYFARVHLACALRGGYYSLQSGLNLQAVYVQFAHPELLTAQTKQCCDAAAREECDSDHATKLYRIFRNCLKDIIPTLGLFQTAAKNVLNKCSE